MNCPATNTFPETIMEPQVGNFYKANGEEVRVSCVERVILVVTHLSSLVPSWLTGKEESSGIITSVFSTYRTRNYKLENHKNRALYVTPQTLHPNDTHRSKRMRIDNRNVGRCEVT